MPRRLTRDQLAERLHFLPGPPASARGYFEQKTRDYVRDNVLDVLMRMPAGIAAQIVVRAVFLWISPGCSCAFEWPAAGRSRPVVLLQSDLWRYHHETLRGLIAHEVAHVYLRHYRGATPGCEDRADQCARGWGFETEVAAMERSFGPGAGQEAGR